MLNAKKSEKESLAMKNARTLVFFFSSLALLFLPGTLVVGDMKIPEGPECFLSHISTDKPIYKPGEDVYVRIVVVNSLDQKPISSSGMANMEILSPKGDVIGRGMTQSENGSLGWQWKIGEAVPGGDYKVKVSFPSNGFPPAERGFNIRAFRQRRLRTQIEFAREGYGPGDEVQATLEATRSEGGIPKGAKTIVIARVDRKEAWRGETTIGDHGFATVRFKLPDTIVEGDGTISFAIEDGGVIETAAKTIPILVSTVDLKAYPEGGDLVPNIENRVYFEAIAPNGRPADVTVELRDSKNNVLLEAKTEHEGRGSFIFTPKTDESCTLQVILPWTVKTKIELPKAAGTVALRAVKEKYSSEEPVTFELASREPCKIILCKREKIIAEKTIEKKELSFTKVSFDTLEKYYGVLRVTALDLEGKPRAERLIYREPPEKIKIEIEPDQEAYVPGDTVKLKIRTFDQAGKSVPGIVGITVTDDAVLEMVETREKAPRLPVQVFLEPELRELADAHVYLSDDPRAPRALDLLLGTQGWRRFAFYSKEEFIKKYADAGRRALADLEPPKPQPMAEGRLWAAAAALGDKGMRRADAGVMNGALEANFNGDIKRLGMKEAIPQPAAMAIPAQPPPPAAFVIADEIQMKQVAKEEIAAFQGQLKIAASSSPDFYLAVREYAHTVRPNRQPNDRVDFAETLYFHAGIATNDKGEASVSFDLSDSVTSFRVLADGYTKSGAFGAGDKLIESRRPFYIEAKMPLEVTAGDKINLPVVFVNETDEDMESGLVVSANAGVSFGEYPKTRTLPAHSRTRVIIPATVENKVGLSELIVTASSGTFTDNVTRSVPVKPLGFPVTLNLGGLLEGKASHTVTIPKSLTEGGMAARATVYPSPLANLTKALEALIRDPNGCFEQTSSTNYPLVMAMQYFETHSGVDPELKKRCREKLAKGYDRLAGFECKQKGYEWFGGDPGHEALTAYGLLEFRDMAKVQPVDPQMLERTQKWLLSRRDGKGGFMRNEKALDSFGGAPAEITNAYITWALVGAGEKDMTKELDALLESATKSEDPYLIALCAGSLLDAGRKSDAAPLLNRLAGKQDKDGSVKGAKTSITRSGGESLLIETTSLSILGWLSDPGYAGNVERAMKWLCEACEGGRFGSTQSTVLALKAIVEYDKTRSKNKADGAVILSVDGKDVETMDFKKEREDAIEFKDIAPLLLPGEHEISLEMKGGSSMPYTIAIEYTAEKPVDAPECPLEFKTEITEKEVKEGEPVEIVAHLKNTTDKGLPMTLVIVGLPGGVEVRHEQLKEAVKAGKFSFYEVLGRDVAIYFRDLAPNAEKEIVISGIAAVPGIWTGPSSRAYLYYTPEEKKWDEGLGIVIQAK